MAENIRNRKETIEANTLVNFDSFKSIFKQ